MMKRIALTLALGALILGQPLSAAMCDGFACGTFEGWAQATYLQPMGAARDYIIQTEAPVNTTPVINGPIKLRTTCPDYQWGFEVGLSYLADCDCFYAEFFGGRTQFTDKATAQGFVRPNLPITIAGSGEVGGTAEGRLKMNYWYLDGRVGHFLVRDCCSTVHTYLGFRYVDLSEGLKIRLNGLRTVAPSVSNQINISQRSEFSGTGPAIGLGGQFTVWGDFGLSGEFGVMGLIGTRKSRVRTIDEAFGATPVYTNQEHQFDSCVAVIPALDFRAGLNWAYKCRCVQGGIELGYRLDHYFDAFKSYTSTTVVSMRSIGFAGPYLNFSLAY